MARAPLLARVGLLSQDAAAMLPAVTEVKDEAKLVARPYRVGDLQCRVVVDDLVVLERIRVHKPDPPPTRELELVQMRQIPPREGLVDRLSQRQKRVRRPNDEDSARCRPQPRPEAPEKINPNLKPRPRHRRRTLRHGF